MPDTINQKVFTWARSKLGQQVGSGECWDLANQALRQAGAGSSTTTGKDDDYKWGSAISLRDVIPGDILQFRDYSMTIVATVRSTFSDGSYTERTETTRTDRPHHTAIVDAVLDTQQLAILEQNAPPRGRWVQRHTLPTQNVVPTRTTAHKNMKDPAGRMKAAMVVTTTTITVTGKIWAFRPQSAK